VGGQSHATTALPPWKGPDIHCTGGGWAPGLVWTGAQNLTSPLEYELRVARPVASRCTNCAILLFIYFFFNRETALTCLKYITIECRIILCWIMTYQTELLHNTHHDISNAQIKWACWRRLQFYKSCEQNETLHSSLFLDQKTIFFFFGLCSTYMYTHFISNCTYVCWFQITHLT